MALSEMEVYGPPDQGPGGGPEDRLPPQDVAAERSALGSMMLSKDAIAECSEMVKAQDFYRPAHETIFEACVDLYSRGEPVDAITVGDELTKRGDLQRIGGTAYLHQLIAEVPTAANAAFYAEIVAERAVLRRLVDAGTRIVQIGYQGGDVEDIVNAAQAEVYAVADKRGGEDYQALGMLIEPTMDEIEHAAGSSGEMTGVPTGFAELDELTNGLHPGQMVIIAARPAVGKALALETPLPTPGGWTTMGEVTVGDELLGADGRPTSVVAATEVMHDRPCYEVEFSDGSVIVADEEHLWACAEGDGHRVLTTGEAVTALEAGDSLQIGRGGDQPATWAVREIRSVTSVPVRCVQVAARDHLYLAGRSMIPTHNSTIALDFARAAAIKHQMATVVFSLEMSRTEITMRLLSAESEIPLQNMRKGNMRDRDWTRLAETQGRITDAPLFIDDSPNMSLMEIRAKCRRLKQRNNLRMVIIDYLQLMSSGKRVESRQQEVAEFSRALKLLAKELEVPVIALSQLNRGPEQRTDKKPQMSDLRESGCLTADTRVLRADTGAEVTLGELHERGAKDVPVWSLDESLRYVRRHLTHVFPTGRKPVFRLTLASGKTVAATENHPFLTYDGWKQLGDLRDGDRLAVPRHVPAPEQHEPWDDDHRVVLLAHMLGDGSMLRRQPLRYASIDEENLRAVTTAALSFGVVAVRDEYAAARCTTLRLRAPFRLARGRRNPIAEWLDDLGVFDRRSHEKFVPEQVFHLSKRQIGLFLHHLWATDGSVTVNRTQDGGRVYYASTSRRLVDDISRLLLRFGISCRIRTVRKTGYRDGYTLDISGSDSQRRFLQEIGVFGGRSASAAQLLEVIRDRQANTNVDTVPREVWGDVRRVMGDRGMTTRQLQAAAGSQYCGSTFYRHAPSRERLGRIATVLDSAELELYAVNDVFWDEVRSVELVGIEEVYDATVLGNHNFVANGIAVHNSIEQDADVVILLHRESLYERESPREGEADVIVAKHRNGPTDTVVVAFQGHYSRFTNMASNF
ncbi:replicative DNA helicase [Serinicoccus chungangensis]|uniref:Replicative DNA helicase n=1 Tax=Serinicoccus chungangensis TaxID=767452 RepID=A0A0W8IAQ1_9MICO|nr:replicative DNA helicase [Serinicoccus chungangensis]KUG57062.1 replicative DNA helicase [Serinicoccus chungangensis]